MVALEKLELPHYFVLTIVNLIQLFTDRTIIMFKIPVCNLFIKMAITVVYTKKTNSLLNFLFPFLMK
jgi:hypothetical protein